MIFVLHYITGEKITANISPLGYILGDEGSGAVLGKRLVGDFLKHQLPDDLCRDFLKEYDLTPALILDKVYRQPLANRFLAGLTPFLFGNTSCTIEINSCKFSGVSQLGS